MILLKLFVVVAGVKLKILKANHNLNCVTRINIYVVYIRKVKKSESKSQPYVLIISILTRCVYP